MSTDRFLPKALTAALVGAGLAFGASAQPAGTAGSGTSGATRSAATAQAQTLSHGDRKFVEAAARDGMAEVQLGQLAASKAASDDVKKFGQRMVDDHGKANAQLKELAGSKGLTLPSDLDSKHKREHDRLSKLSGADFDRDYMKMMVSEHKKDVREFESTAKSAKDADVRAFASTTLPKLQEHLRMAQSTESAVHSASRGGMTKSGSSGPRSSADSPGTTSSVTGGTGNASGAGSATAHSGSGAPK